MRMRRTRFAASLALAFCLIAGPLAAENLAELIPNLFDQTIVLAPPTTGQSHAAHFIDEQERLLATGLLINASLITQLATFPLGSSSGGFTYTYDETLGVFNRTSESFGPVYAERAPTIGRGKWNAGFSYQAAEYDEIDGIDLDGGALAFPLFHQDTNNDGGHVNLFFEGDVINASSRIELESKTTVLFATYGVTDRFDLSLAVPVLAVDLNAQAVLSIDHLATGDRGIHRFPDGSSTRLTTANGSASGIGDVVVRGKLRLWGEGASGGAAALDLRLPTGDEQDLLGTGATQGKIFLIASGAMGSFSPHANLGYTISSGGGDLTGDLPDEINYAAGFDWALHPRLTLAVDGVGRILQDAHSLQSRSRTVQFTTVTGGPVQSAEVLDLTSSDDDLNLVLGSAGIRWNPGGNFLLTLNALFSLSDDGLQDKDIIPLIGIDYSF
jgi:hypothetical protein